MRVHMLLKQTVDEDRQGSETNIIQSQVYTVIERLQRKAESILCPGIYKDLLARLQQQPLTSYMNLLVRKTAALT